MNGRHPVLYSFRRCPYAMRARLALRAAGVRCELREVVLRDKPEALIAASPKGTVPVLVTPDARVIDESLDIMQWALRRNDPEGWLEMPAQGRDLIARFDTEFKAALDRYKYASRHADADPLAERARAAALLRDLDGLIGGAPWIFGAAPRLADMAIVAFVRQFAFVDKAWFDAQEFGAVQGWLERFLRSGRFAAIMERYPQWQPGVGAPLF
ncbi:glutathione S-transferase [Brevirhabdus sp.]|uniref:glutathione S-transferase n=1 Tax=Brevirhabdus sp. TaxID=2004514 RepID=UPI004059DAA1